MDVIVFVFIVFHAEKTLKLWSWRTDVLRLLFFGFVVGIFLLH